MKPCNIYGIAVRAVRVCELIVTDGHSFTQVTTQDLVWLARDLLARGASPGVQSTGHYDYTVLMNLCQTFPADAVSSLLVDGAIPPFAKADPNVKSSYDGSTALSIVLRSRRSFRDKLTLVKALLRAGASLDACYGQQSAEDLLREQADEDPDYIKLNSLIAGVRAEGGSYEIYAKKDTLVLRELVVREKATIVDPGAKKFFKILAECPDDVTKHILTYCRW